MFALVERAFTLARLWVEHEDRGGKVSTREFSVLKVAILYQAGIRN